MFRSKRLIIKIIAGVAIAGSTATAAANIPFVPVDMRWVKSYETVSFDTPDGDLAFDEYAIGENGEGYYVRPLNRGYIDFDGIFKTPGKLDKTQGNFLFVPSTYDISGLRGVRVAGKAYYDEFESRSGEYLRVQNTRDEYVKLSSVENYPQPQQTELVTLISAGSADAALAFDAVTTATGTSVTSLSFSHTTSGDNRLLHIGVGITTCRSVLDASYNGASSTPIRTDSDSNCSNIFYLTNPTVGSNTVSVAIATPAPSALAAAAMSLTGADQLAPVVNHDGFVTPGSAQTSYSIQLTSGASGNWVVDTLGHGGGSTVTNTVGASQTSRWEHDLTAPGFGGSNEVSTSSSPHTMSWTLNTGRRGGLSAVVYRPTDATAPATGATTTDTSVKIRGGTTIRGGVKFR